MAGTSDGAVLGAMIAVALGGLAGCVFLWRLRRQDHYSWVLARAPVLPIRVLATGDDAWLRGVVRCAAPLRCPWFDVACVAYKYSIERQVTWTTTDKDGKVQVHTEWRQEHAEADAVDFELDDGARVTVLVADADNEALDALGTDYEHGARRHSASVLRPGDVVSVLGVARDGGAFGPAGEVPCLITPLAPVQRVRRSQGSETALFAGAWLVPFLGGGVATFLLLDPALRRDPPGWALVLGGALLLMLPFWWVGVHNRLVRLRQQVLAAFRQVDVDLGVRAGLVPNLVAVVQAHAGHERSLLTDLAAIRAGRERDDAVRAEGSATAAARVVLALHERYPELHADALYRDLHERLWAVEEKLAHTRSLYNAVVKEWNDRIGTFPSSLVARCNGYRRAPPFAGDDAPLPPPLRARDAEPA